MAESENKVEDDCLPAMAELIFRAGSRKRVIRCKDCDVAFDLKESSTWRSHFSSNRHSRSASIRLFNETPKAASALVVVEMEWSGDGSGGRAVLDEGDVARIECERSGGALLVKGRVQFHVKNVGSEASLTLVACHVLSSQPLGRCLQMDICPGGQQIAFGGCATTLGMSYRLEHVGTYRFPVVFELTRAATADEEASLNARRTIEFAVVNEDTRRLAPVAPFAPSHWQRRRAVSPPHAYICRSDRLPMNTRDQLTQELSVGVHSVPLGLRLLAVRGFREFDGMTEGQEDELHDLMATLRLTPTDMDEYAKKYTTMLHIEEMQLEVSIRNYDLASARMKPFGGGREPLFEMRVEGVAEKRPSVLRGDHVYLRALVDGDGGVQYEGVVHRVGLDKLVLGFSRAFERRQFDADAAFSARFSFGRLPIKMQQRALILARELSLGHVLFPKASQGLQPSLNMTDNLEWFDDKLAANAEQCEAVRQIVRGRHRPAPYVVFGPPGTGKTVTLVEAIKQVVTLNVDARVVACAPSNTAADLLCQRVLKHLSKDSVLRLNAVSRRVNAPPLDVLACSNTYNGANGEPVGFFLPARSTLDARRLIVSTLVTAGRLVSACFPDGYFTHVFIDEAGQASEPEALIAVAGLLPVRDGHVVLAGDPRQLSPVLHSVLAERSGLGRSLMERLMNDVEIYQPNGQGKYDSTFLTKLLKNYRSHPSIFEVPSELFYGGELEPCADVKSREALCRLPWLPCQGLPLVFHGVVGEELREANSPSFFNPSEVAVVRQYVDALIKEGVAPVDVGIITPYRKQVHKVCDLLRAEKAKYGAVTAGSVEEFQGTERQVVIVSTVRSNADMMALDKDFKLGFLTNPKRFNTAVTRAKALLIIVGNPMVLERDASWNRLLQYACEKGAYVGVPYEWSSDGRLVNSDGLGISELDEQAKARAEEMGLLIPEE